MPSLITTPSPNVIHAELNDFKAIKARLLTMFPDLDEETLADTLEGATNLKEVLIALIRSALEDEQLHRALAARIADMRARGDRLEWRADTKRQIALQTMTTCELKRVEEADFTASIRQGAPSLEVVEEDRIPAAYWKPQPTKLDRQGVLAALKAGVVIEGAAIKTSAAQLNVRTR